MMHEVRMRHQIYTTFQGWNKGRVEFVLIVSGTFQRISIIIQSAFHFPRQHFKGKQHASLVFLSGCHALPPLVVHCGSPLKIRVGCRQVKSGVWGG